MIGTIQNSMCRLHSLSWGMHSLLIVYWSKWDVLTSPVLLVGRMLQKHTIIVRICKDPYLSQWGIQGRLYWMDNIEPWFQYIDLNFILFIIHEAPSTLMQSVTFLWSQRSAFVTKHSNKQTITLNNILNNNYIYLVKWKHLNHGDIHLIPRELSKIT